MRIGLLIILVIGLIVIVGFFLLKKGKEIPKSNSIAEKFKGEQNALNEFNERFNILTEQYPKRLILEYLELLINRFPSENGQIEDKIREEALRLIPCYEGIIVDFKKDNIDNKYLDRYQKLYSTTIEKNKENMDFVAIYSLVGLELIGKLGNDAKKVGNVAVESRVDLEFGILNQNLLDLTK